jgi:hypothetical protein
MRKWVDELMGNSSTHIHINSYTHKRICTSSPQSGVVRQMSKVFDKSAFFCKTNPILLNVQLNLKLISTRSYDNFCSLMLSQKRTQFKPKRSQFKGRIQYIEHSSQDMEYRKNMRLDPIAALWIEKTQVKSAGRDYSALSQFFGEKRNRDLK